MHISFSVLLAVSFNLAAAGLIRRIPYDRSFNQSSVAIAPVDQGRLPTTRDSTSIISTWVGVQLSPAVQTASVLSARPSRQVGSVPAVGDGLGAASIESMVTTKVLAKPSPTSVLPASLPPSITVAPTFPVPSSKVANNATASAPATKQAGLVPAFGSGPGAASVVSSYGIISLTKDSSISSQPSFATSARSLPAKTAALVNVDEAQTSAITTKQVGSVPAIGSSPEAASVGDDTLTHKAASSVTRIASVAPGIRSGNISEIKTTAAATSLSLFPSSPDQTLTSYLVETRSLRGSSSSRAVTRLIQPTGVATELPSTNATRLSILAKSTVPSASSSTTRISSIQPPTPRITEFPDSQGNAESAIQFNQFFSSLGPNSQCSSEVNTQAVVCINKQIATCGSNFRYVLQPCPEGQSCAAVPLDNASKGISVQCIIPKDVTSRLSSDQPSSRSSVLIPSLSSLESATQNAAGQGTSTTPITQESPGPSSQILVTFSTFQTTTSVSAESESLVGSQTNAPSSVRSTRVFSPLSTSPTSALPIATSSASSIPSAAKATEPPKNASRPTTLITRASETFTLAPGIAPPISEAPASLSIQVPESKTVSPSNDIKNQPTLAVIPEKRRTSFLGNPEATPSHVALSIVVKPAAPAITINPKVAADTNIVTVTVTVTVHDKA